MGERARWSLPNTVDPANKRCFLVQVPDDIMHIGAFRGALWALCNSLNWQQDDAHTSRAVAEVWRQVWANIQEVDCDMLHQTLIEFDPDCGIKWSYDGGETWETADLAACALAGGELAIDNALADGTLAQYGGQPSPSAPPAPGECKTYHVILRAQDKWHIPSPLNAGDTLTITNVKGGWEDGTYLWYCPNGDEYLLGACVDIQIFYPADPMPDTPHMQVIGARNTTIPVFFELLNAPYLVPVGITDEDAWLQANDSDLPDNGGQIEFDLEVCTGAWEHHFDFTAGELGWTALNLDGQRAEYVAGVGWHHASGYTSLIQLKSPIVSSTEFLGVRIILSTSMGGPHKNGQYRKGDYSTPPADWYIGTLTDTGMHTVTGFTQTQVGVGIDNDNSPGGVEYTGYITDIYLSGRGIDPF